MGHLLGAMAAAIGLALLGSLVASFEIVEAFDVASKALH